MSRYAAALEGFSCETVTCLGVAREVYRAGEGPPVIVMAEVPGITPKVLAFARRIVEHGMSVHLPQMFGVPGRPPSTTTMLTTIVRACIASEFATLASRRASPITEWLRALARTLHDETGSPVGAVGMCLTGNFALTLALDPWLTAPVLSQPSLPFRLPGRAGELHITDEGREVLKRRAAEEDLTVLGLRFTGDPLCPRARFDALRDLLGDHFEAIEIDSSPGNPSGHRRMAHSVLTEDLIDEEGQPSRRALDRTLEFFSERLLGPR